MMNKELELEGTGVLFAAMQNTLGGYFTDKIAARFIIDYVSLAIRKGQYV